MYAFVSSYSCACAVVGPRVSSTLCSATHQIKAVSDALDRHYDFDRYSRSRGHDRHRDEHTDLASLSTSVPGKTPSQVSLSYDAQVTVHTKRAYISFFVAF